MNFNLLKLLIHVDSSSPVCQSQTDKDWYGLFLNPKSVNAEITFCSQKFEFLKNKLEVNFSIKAINVAKFKSNWGITLCSKLIIYCQSSGAN